MKKLLLLLALLFSSKLTAQDTSIVKFDSLAAQQAIQLWDSAAKVNFPDKLIACVYGGYNLNGSIVVDSMSIVDGPCNHEERRYIGLLSFMNGLPPEDEKYEWYTLWTHLAVQDEQLLLVGSVYRIAPKGDAPRWPYLFGVFRSNAVQVPPSSTNPS